MQQRFYEDPIVYNPKLFFAPLDEVIPSFARRRAVVQKLEMLNPKFQGIVYKLLSSNYFMFMHTIDESDLLKTKANAQVTVEYSKRNPAYRVFSSGNFPLENNPYVNSCLDSYVGEYYRLTTGVHCCINRQELMKVSSFGALRYYDYDKLLHGVFINYLVPYKDNSQLYSTIYTQVKTCDHKLEIDGIKYPAIEVTYHSRAARSQGTFTAWIIPELYNTTGEIYIRDDRNPDYYMLDFQDISRGYYNSANCNAFLLDDVTSHTEVFGDFGTILLSALITCEEVCKHCHKDTNLIASNGNIKSKSAKPSKPSYGITKFRETLRPVTITQRVKSCARGTHASPVPHERMAHERHLADGRVIYVRACQVGGRIANRDKLVKIPVKT